MSSNDVAFLGPVPVIYDDFLGPMMFGPYAADLALRLGGIESGSVLETAAGTGVVTRALVEALPAAVSLVATDLNEAMLAVASARTTGRAITWKQADAQALPFEDGSFAAVVCQFGMMFLPDKPKGFQEAARVLAKGGRFVFNVWDRVAMNPVTEIIGQTLAEVFPADPPRFIERTPFGYFDEARIRADIGGAFARVDFETVEKVTRTTAAKAAAGLCKGTPIRGEVESRGGNLDEVAARAAEAIGKRLGSGEIENRMRAIVVTASK